MNGAHDLGGMHGFGPVEREENEPVFHAPWERAVYAMIRVGGQQFWNIDEFRHAIERMGNARYVTTTYYEHWLASLDTLLVEKGVLTEAEIAARQRYLAEHPEVDASATPGPLARGQRLDANVALPPSFRRAGPPPRFHPGDAVVTRNHQPRGHTRLPRYVRSRRGVIARVHGIFVYPDTNAHGLGEQPCALYSVRFEGAELWGDAVEGTQAVYLDLWERYLEPAAVPA